MDPQNKSLSLNLTRDNILEWPLEDFANVSFTGGENGRVIEEVPYLEYADRLFPNIRSLSISFIDNADLTSVTRIQQIEKLSLGFIYNMSYIPPLNTTNITHLRIHCLHKLEMIPELQGLPIKHLSLVTLPSLKKFPSLEGLPIEDLHVMCIPDTLQIGSFGSGDLRNLSVTSMNYSNLPPFPSSIRKLSLIRVEGMQEIPSMKALEELSVHCCPDMKSISGSCTPNLKHLDVDFCDQIREIDMECVNLESLHVLSCMKNCQLKLKLKLKYIPNKCRVRGVELNGITIDDGPM